MATLQPSTIAVASALNVRENAAVLTLPPRTEKRNAGGPIHPFGSAGVFCVVMATLRVETQVRLPRCLLKKK